MALVVVEVSPLGTAVSSDQISALLKQWYNSTNFSQKVKIKKILTPDYNAQIINLANKGDVYAQQFQSAYISAEAATAAIEPVSTTSSHSGRGTSTTTRTGTSGHTGSSSSTGTTVVHSGASTTTQTMTAEQATASNSHASSSGSSSSHATSSSGGYTAVTTTEGGAVQVPENANPFVESIVSSRTGQTQYYVSSLDPNAGSWTFKLNNGSEYTTTNYEEAQLIEAALYYVGKGPRSGANSWTAHGVTYYTYEEAWQAYEQELAQTLQRLANNGNTTENGQMNEQALLAAMMQQQQQNQETTTADDLTEYNYDTTPAQTKKKNTWLWWLLGGAVVVSGILIYRSNKKRR